MNLRVTLSQLTSRGMWNSQSVAFVCISMICILAPLELSQLIFAFIGALVYAVLQAITPKPQKTNCQVAAEREHRGMRSTMAQRFAPTKIATEKQEKQGRTRPRNGPSSAVHSAPPHSVKPETIKREVYHPSSNPVYAPKFESTGWEDEVNELVAQMNPGVEEEHAVQRLVFHVKRTIQSLFPEVEVTGFVHSSLKCGKAFGVAVPEVDIVANISPSLLAQRSLQRTSRYDLQKLHKCAVRSACDRLVSNGGLKFRRSAFRGEEPRVTVLVPTSLGFFSEAIPVDFSINAVTPFYTAALLTECGQIEPRAKALLLLVKRWAKDRGICHAAKGHLSPYLWTLLAVYFLQVGFGDEGALLPLFEAFKISSCNPKNPKLTKQKTPSSSPTAESAANLSVAQLFRKCMEFYSQTFDWRNEAVSIRNGHRAPPNHSLPIHVILRDDGSRHDVGPAIEDPFKVTSNLGSCMNEVSLARLHEEFARAHELCARGASLTELLEPWVPPSENPEQSSGSSPGEQDEKAPVEPAPAAA